MTETVIKGSIRLIKHIDAELETSENAPTPQAEAEIPAATDPSAPEGSAYFVSPDAAAPKDAQETAASVDAKDAAEPAAEETPMPDQTDTETPAESEPEAADTLIPGQNEAEPEPENGSVPTAEFNPSGNAGIIEQPEAGAMFQLYLSGAGSYDAAKDSERDLLVTDENGVALSKDLPYGRYTVHQIEGQEGQAFVPDFTVFISSDGHLYSYILNNQTITSFIRVEKRDAETGKIIPAAGIGFQVRDLTSGELISQTVYYPAPVTISTFYTADDGTFNLIIGAADMGTGCDTILAQMVAECMDCSVDDVAVFGADTDASPYDSGSYASSTTYVTGKAVELACEELKKKLCAIAAGMLGCEPEETVFEDGCVRKINTDERVTLAQISVKDQVANDIAAVATASHSSPVSPPPYMVGMVEIELDRYTGEVKILDYVAVVDCGIAINPALARIQAEGGIVQGIGHTLFENITYDETGKPVESNFMQYKIPTRLDMGHLRVEFENSYEPTGPFGAKSIGEIVINTPAPAIAHAIYRATGVWHRELPITPEKILMSMPEDDFR